MTSSADDHAHRAGDDTRPSLADRDFRRILIVKPSSLGDVIHALPVLHALRRRYPGATISWLVADPFAPLIADHPDLDDVILFDRARFNRVGRRVAPSLEFIEFLRELRAREYDLAIDLQGLFRSGFLSFASGAPVRIGARGARECAWFFYTHRIPVADAHAADRNRAIVRVLGIDCGSMRFDLGVTEEERGHATDILRDAGLARDASFVAVWPGARWETKRWPADKFVDLLDRLGEVTPLSPVLMGDPGEKTLCDSIASRSSAHPAVLAGKTTIRQAVALLERAALVITHDSAPMHIAAALDRPLVAIVGPTNPRRTGPYGIPDAVLQIDVTCAPCYLRRFAQCSHDHQCMRELEVADVLRHVAAVATRGGTQISV